MADCDEPGACGKFRFSHQTIIAHVIFACGLMHTMQFLNHFSLSVDDNGRKNTHQLPDGPHVTLLLKGVETKCTDFSPVTGTQLHSSLSSSNLN